ncbi:GntR family transcriptional regulator [Aminobacter aminovorans]|uniref:Pyruvate dehydrogenase complex repressor n=1 Tax=Aminobacter aminovorans TaxID=83263 RepID=A0A380WR13_AMIAI|nr:FCD domain-containing protein [Aminobacter aminovorans]TCS30481.1 GntR family transcriptional regulator [Aminobacter aminovorans]SUU91330.1 Pyruvate dehydrogenase complex repressor [Aminobacter aminovorans]
MSDIFSRIEHSRTADEVVQQIESLILEGVLRAGDRLPGEREMAKQFDVSRPILRDALKTLEARGLMVTRHGGGTSVADVIGEVFSKPVMELIVNHRKAAADYLEYRREIEGLAAEYAAQRATAEDLALLDGIVARMEAAHARADPAEESAVDVEFHHAVGECAHNIILLHTLRSCYRLLSDGVFTNRLVVFTVSGTRDVLLEQHKAIHRAVVAGDPAAARKAAMDHITYLERAMAEAERSGDWQRISRLRLRQRTDSTETGRKP